MSNKELDDVAKKQRGRFDAEMASRADSARIVLRWLRDRKPVMLGADMDYGMRNSTFVPFFGVQACTLTAVGRLAQDRARAGHAVRRRGAAELQGLPAQGVQAVGQLPDRRRRSPTRAA